MKSFLAAVTAILSLAGNFAQADAVRDVVIYGGTSAGVAAAVQVARMGGTAVVIEPGQHLGGLSSGGLGATDIGNKTAIGGISREFYRRVRTHYNDEKNWKQEQRAAFRGRGHQPGEDTAWTFEPHVAENIFKQMIAESQVEVVFGQRLDRQNGVKQTGQRITSITMESGEEYAGRMFIDATYEGDLMAAAGVRYTVGREAAKQYGESLNGVQTGHARHHQFIKNVDPYIKPGDPTSGVLPGIQADGPGEELSGDDRVQAYCFRLCATDAAENRRPWPKPADYDPLRYELLLRNFDAGDHRIPWNPVRMPNRKTDSNNNFAVSTDNIGMNYDYPDGDYATRERIIQEHETYQKGLMWTLANHPRVPARVREHFQTWGLSKDEFTDNDNWPHQLYIREARRMVADYVMTQANCRRLVVVEDSVGMGAYNMDSHHVQRYITKEGFVRNEGDVQVGSRPYPVSLRSIVPRAEECPNLVVPVCLSASHIAYGSIRMEPVFMVLGQSAATVAMHATEQQVSVQKIDYARLKQRLLADKQVLDLDLPPGRPVYKPIKLAALDGVAQDDEQAELKGFEATSSSISPYVDAGYRHDNNERKGQQTARFRLKLPQSGEYEVRVAYSENANRASNVPVTVHHSGGSDTVLVNQRKPPKIEKLFTAVGVYEFTADSPAVVEISNRGTNGHVIIDAVVLAPVEGKQR